MNKDLEQASESCVIWTPKRMTGDDLLYVLQDYGYYNDTLMSEKNDSNVVKWKLDISLKRIGGAELWP